MRSGEMHKSNIPSVKGVAGVASVNTRAGVVTLVPSDVGITATTPKSVPFVGAGGFLGEDNAHFNYTVGTHTLAVTNLAVGTLLSAPTIAASLLMTTPEIDLGSTPFVFKDLGGGVLQLGDPALYWDSTNGTLFIGSSGGVNISSTPGTAMVIQADPGRTLQLTSGAIDITVSPAGADEIDLTLGDGTTGFYMVPAMLQPVTDNGMDIGSAAHPWRTGFFGTSVVSPLYSVASGAGNSGLTTTVTTGSLVGKTMTFQGGILTGFA